jgi:hypothetical protein
MITIIDVTSDFAFAQFNLFVVVASVSGIFSLLLVLIKYKYSLISSLLICTLVFTSFIYIGYSSHLNKFHRLTISNNLLYLEHVWPKLNIYIQDKDIKSVTFGAKGRGGEHCFISINLYSGDKFQSVILDEDVKFCKDYRNIVKKIIQK